MLEVYKISYIFCPSIFSCESLEELILTENLLSVSINLALFSKLVYHHCNLTSLATHCLPSRMLAILCLNLFLCWCKLKPNKTRKCILIVALLFTTIFYAFYINDVEFCRDLEKKITLVETVYIMINVVYMVIYIILCKGCLVNLKQFNAY